MPGKHRSKEEQGKVLSLAQQGKSQEHIAADEGIPRRTIRRWLEDPGLAEDSEVLAWMAVQNKVCGVETSLARADFLSRARECAATGEHSAAKNWMVCYGIATDKVPTLISLLSSTPKAINAADSSKLVVLPGDTP